MKDDETYTCDKHGVLDATTLVGMGNPPSCPLCNNENPGGGRHDLSKASKAKKGA